MSLIQGYCNGVSRVPSLLADFLQGVDNFVPASAVNAQRAGWSFPLDVVEKTDAYVVTANLPGVARENIDVSMEKDVLTIAVKQESEQTKEGERFLFRERRNYSASRSLQLEAGNSQAVDATLKDGVLTLEIKKDAAVQPKKIAIS